MDNWIKIKRDKDGFYDGDVIDLYEYAPFIIREKTDFGDWYDEKFSLVDKDSFSEWVGDIDRHIKYTHILPNVPLINDDSANDQRDCLRKVEVLPKFKVGDKVVKKGCISVPILITRVGDTYYWSNTENSTEVLPIANQDDWELVPNKFDITTLKPYDKVLYRMHDKDTWCNSFYSFYKSNHHFVTSLTIVKQCIPYDGNEHLLGTTDDCDEFYKTWE